MADKDDDGWDISSSASPDCSPLLGLTCNRRKSPISSLFLDWGQSCSVLWQLRGLMGNFKPGQQLVLWKLQLTAQHPVFNRIKLSRRVSRKKTLWERKWRAEQGCIFSKMFFCPLKVQEEVHVQQKLHWRSVKSWHWNQNVLLLKSDRYSVHVQPFSAESSLKMTIAFCSQRNSTLRCATPSASCRGQHSLSFRSVFPTFTFLPPSVHGLIPCFFTFHSGWKHDQFHQRGNQSEEQLPGIQVRIRHL